MVAPKKLTPVMRQYDEAKAVHPDAILFFRLGDFYEMFHADAVLASRALGLTLTSRNKGAPDEVPMAGVPHHAAHGYIAKLLAQGHKVALCEQMADPSKVKGIVPRQVVRVITPGLVTDIDQLDARSNHYLVAIEGGGEPPKPFGVALLDLSTGEMSAAAVADVATLLAELSRADPREVLLGSASEPLRAAASLCAPRAAVRDDEPLPEETALGEIDAAVDIPLAAEASAMHAPVALRAAARALRFARRCTPGARLPVRRISALDPSGTLCMDETAQRHLEILRSSEGSRKGSLIDVVDATVTPAGARLLRRRLLAPLVDVAGIRRRLDEVELFVGHARARGELRAALAAIGDLERLCIRAILREASPRDLAGIRDGLAAAPAAAAAIGSIPDVDARQLLDAGIDLCPELAGLLASALVDRPPPHAREGGLTRDGFDAALDELRRARQGGTEMILALESELRAQTGAASLRIRYTRVFGWYIEVTRSQLAKVPQAWRRKQTVAGGERYTNEALDELADTIEHAEDRALAREGEIFERLLGEVIAAADRIRALARTLARWDVASALADVAHRYDYVRPDVDAGDAIRIEEGRHPVVERLAAAGRFVPNDTTLDLDGERLWLITGPNMAGKSTLMRQVALIVILAQAGSYVPARRAQVGLVDRVLSRVGASDNVSRGESTFMVEMREAAQILREATRRSLVILDEIGRGTSTYDGLAIAWAVAEHLYTSIGCRTLFATHYHELCEIASLGPGIANRSVAAREQGDDVVFLHRLVAGAASRSYGIAVARLAGLPEGVLARAKAVLATLESAPGTDAGGHAPVGGKRAGGQLDLFRRGAASPAEASAPVLATLRAVDVDRLTPLDALQLVAKLKGMLEGSSS